MGTDVVRRANLSTILQTVHRRGPTTRAELTRQLGLNRSTIGGLTAELLELGLVIEGTASVAGRSGRPSHLVVPRDDNVVVAVDLGVDRISAALVALGGRVTERRRRLHARGEHDVDHVVDVVAQLVGDLLATKPGARCLGVGVAVPGAIRTDDGLVQFAPNLGWVGEPFTARLSERLGLPVCTGNDANLGVLAEHMRGAAVGFDHAAYLAGSVGIGGGFLVGGTLLGGSSGYAGEVGHLQVDSAGPVCRCGATGCWEMKAGENRLLQLAGRLPGGGPDAVAEVIDAARGGEARARDALAETAEWVGAGLRAVVNVFNPDIIVLGGSLAQVWDVQADVVRATVKRTALPALRDEVEIASARLGGDSPLVGAAELAFAPVLEDPQDVGSPQVALG
ncbi:ROK family transcriptional regulator [Nocardioides marinquilinus]|uniref:ROK family transcriptional regulator n=1 Tax=Nocardioides marinquilinus TaxID=1210400 RepID=A0ABP9PZ14_9ACTN